MGEHLLGGDDEIPGEGFLVDADMAKAIALNERDGGLCVLWRLAHSCNGRRLLNFSRIIISQLNRKTKEVGFLALVAC